MKVLLVTADFPPDVNGVGDYTAQLAQHLVAGGVDTGVLTRVGSADDSSLPYAVHRSIDDWTVKGLPTAVGVCRSYDVVHVQYPGVACGRGMLLNRLPAQLDQIPSVATFHEFRSMRTRWRARASILCRGLDAALVVDGADASHLRRWSRLVRPLSPLQPAAVPISSNIEVAEGVDRDAVRAELGLSEGETAVAFFGILYPHKGVGLLLDAVRSLPNYRAVVIGNFDREAEWRPAMEARLNAEAVWVRDADARRVSEVLQACDVAALPYDSGAGPNRSSLLAAMAHGLPAVTTNGPATPRDFARRDDIAFVPPGDVEALVRALSNPVGTVAALRAKAWTASLSWPAVAARHADLYRTLLGAS